MVKSSSPPAPRLRRPPPLTPCSGDRFKGVRRRSWGRWVSEIRIPHSRDKIWLGSYSTAEQAARAYDIASLLLRGPSCAAYLNFADSTTLMSTNHQLAALVAEGIASPRTIQATASAAANSASAPPNSTVLVQEGAACSNGDGSSHDLDDENYPQSSETSTKDCGDQSHNTHQSTDVENKGAAHADVYNSMPGSSSWIQDVLTLIMSPRDKNSPPSFSCSLQLSPSIARCSTSCPPTPIHNSGHGLQSSSKATSPDYLLHMLFDDFQYPLEDLLRDGFTAMSPAVTTRKRIDTETVGPSCEVDAMQLWSYLR